MKIVLGGDSTVADYPLDQQPMMGWGQALPSYLPPEVNVRNFAKNGSTTRSFIEEGLFEQLLQEVEPNTVVLLQFGHNDQKEKNHVTMEAYIAHLTDMIRQIKEKAGIPILCTPVERRVGEEGRLAHTLSAFLPVLRELSRTEEVVLFDLNRYTYHYYDTLGLEASKALFVWLAPNEHPNYPAGLADDTHFSKLGAHMIARY
ncbi:rhamnogalacturonan acetylesterase, partial [Pseudomonas monteilii]|nr:rhamnogalacturonan acetylesterase [Pseudomonas monteilii]